MKLWKRLGALLLAALLILGGCGKNKGCKHKDEDSNGVCDSCHGSVFVFFDFYTVNDLHGKVADGLSHPGVDELTTYLKGVRETDENAVFLAAGDMFQGSPESNATYGGIVTDWMNELDFAAMAVGNHDFDWGEDYLRQNAEAAEFPFLAINIYEHATGQLAPYCAPSTVVEAQGVQIGIIGAIGDCYSSIAVDQCDEVYFKVGAELTRLVKEESTRLREEEGVDFVVYLLHDGHGQSGPEGVQSIASSTIKSYYDTALSDGYVDLVFEGHTHQGYRLQDEHGVYHLQNGGDNEGGISHAEISVNLVTGAVAVRSTKLVSVYSYQNLEDDPLVQGLMDKYATQIAPMQAVLGTADSSLSRDALRELVAKLYYEAGVKAWGDKYKIALGGGFLSVRSPGYVPSGPVTYGDLQSVLPFDNDLVLCSVKGRELNSKFFNNDHYNYFIYYGDYGASIKGKVDPNATYYVVVDTYTSDYKSNRLTVVERYTPGVYARDLLADYIRSGGLGEGAPAETPATPGTQTPSGGNPAIPGVQTPSGGGSGTPGAQTPSGGTPGGTKPACTHKDGNGDTICDTCAQSVIVYFDFYNINDLHGKLDDTSAQPGVDELTTYLKNARKTEQNALFLSSGDMWQGSAESNLTYGRIITDWMNDLDFVSMTLGNHEFDWGESYIKENEKAAEFPLLAINVFDSATNVRVSYCDASVMVEGDGLQIGIIGAIGDCYSSISSDKTEGVYFKVGSQLTSLVKAESTRLRQAGADFILYVLHDGYGQSGSGVQQMSSSQLKSYYDTSLSNGYVDLVFEGHTHQGYRIKDEHGVYHLQNRGDNKGGISHAEVAINSVTLDAQVKTAELISSDSYTHLADDPVVENLKDKYADALSKADRVLGYNASYRNSDAIGAKLAQLYYETAVATWGKKYDIVLGGGYLTTRSPYNLTAGPVKYGTLQTLLPFDNQLVLCSIKGKELNSKFFNSTHDDYHIYYGDYGASVKKNVKNTSTYYVVVDYYTAQYAPNKLTVVEEYAPDVFPRDLLADFIASGGWD